MDDYQRSDGAVYLIGLHIIWCPKYRKPLLVGPVAARLKELLTAIADFPEPVHTLGGGVGKGATRLWRSDEALAWFETHPRRRAGRPKKG